MQQQTQTEESGQTAVEQPSPLKREVEKKIYNICAGGGEKHKNSKK